MKNKTIDKVFDAMLDEAAEEYVQNLGKQLMEIDTSDVEFSQRHNNNMQKFFNARRRKQKIISFYSYTKKLACVLVLVCILSATAIGSVEAWREKFLSYVFNPDSQGTEFNLGDKSTNSYYSSWGMNIKYIPEGFEMSQEHVGKEMDIMFIDKNELYFAITVHKSNDIFGMDTENADFHELVINGNEAISSSNENGNTILWYDGKYMYSTYGNISQNELLKIVKNIEVTRK